MKNYKSTGAPRRVVVALRMAGIAGQDKLNGIFDYLSAGRRWQLIIYRTKHEFTAEVVKHELSRGTDGFIVGIPGTEDALGVLAATDIPTVVMNVSGGGIEKRTKNIAFVKSDSQAVGREAAHALLRQGVYKSYGYAGYRARQRTPFSDRASIEATATPATARTTTGAANAALHSATCSRMPASSGACSTSRTSRTRSRTSIR